MNLAKSLLLGTVAGFAAVAGAQAADLPSRKAAPVNYVKICDAYGAGFFFIPGTDTCLKVGGYVRVQYDYTPGNTVLSIGAPGAASLPVGAGVFAGTGAVVQGVTGPVAVAAGVPVAGNGLAAGISQVGGSQDTTGTEVRGRVDLDARTPTAMGTVRTFVRLRAANASGIRNNVITNNGINASTAPSATAISIESAFVQWAGFTFGVAPENYAMMPGIMYSGQAWAGFPNGIKQLAYTATFGGGFSATLAIEDRTEFGYVAQTYRHSPLTGYHLVANVRVDQSWGFAALHGMIGNNSIRSDISLPTAPLGGALGGVPASTGTLTPLLGSTNFTGYAIGATAKINLPMIAAGDALWLTANYTKGLLGAVLGGGGLNNISTAAQHRWLGGIQRVDTGLNITSCAPGFTSCSVGQPTAWNVGAIFTHYWAPQWRSNFSAAYVEINPASVSINTNNGAAGSTAMQWGKGSLWQVGGSLIYSPVQNFDIGLEVQYASMKNQVQNPTINFQAQGMPGLKANGITAKFRVERQF